MNKKYTSEVTEEEYAKYEAGEEVRVKAAVLWKPTVGHKYSPIVNLYKKRSLLGLRECGLTRADSESSNKLERLLVKYARLLTYIYEKAPNHDVEEWGYIVYYKSDLMKYKSTQSSDKDLLTPTMPEKVAKQLAQDLNDGVVVL